MSTKPLTSSFRRDRLVTIQAPIVTRSAATGAQVLAWADVTPPLWAEVRESATAGGRGDEGQAAAVATYMRPTQVRILYRAGITPRMRISLGGARYLQITGMAMLGRREVLDLACKEWAHG